MSVKIQTEGFVVIGVLPNEERYPCLICGDVPEPIWQDLFPVDPGDIPESLPLPAGTNLVVTYRLCPSCHKSKPDPWKIRLLILARLKVAAGSRL
jgi:hypothetical protein